MVDLIWKIAPYLLVVQVILVGVGIFAVIIWGYIQYKKRHSLRFQARRVVTKGKKWLPRIAFVLGIKWTKEKEQAFWVFVSGTLAVLLSIIINPPGFWEARLGVQVYILTLTATLPAVIFILTLASRLPETYNPFGAFFRLTSVKAIIKGELIFLVVLLLLPRLVLRVSTNFTVRISWLLCLWAAVLSLYLVSKILSGVVDRRRILQARKTVKQEKINLLMDQQSVASIGDLLFRNLREGYHIEPYPILGFERERAEGFSDVLAKRKGIIVDIDPQKLARLSEVCDGPQNILLHHSINADVEKNTPLVAIRETVLNKKAKRMGRSVFTIKKPPPIPQSFGQSLEDITQDFFDFLGKGLISEAEDTLDFYTRIWQRLLDERVEDEE